MKNLLPLGGPAKVLVLGVTVAFCCFGCQGRSQFFEPSFTPVAGIRGAIGFFIDDGAHGTRVSYSVDLSNGKTSLSRAPTEIKYSDGSEFKNHYFVIPINSWCDADPPLGAKLEPLRSPDGAKSVMCHGGSGTAYLSLEPGDRTVALGADCPVLKGMYWSPDAASLVLVCGLQAGATDPVRIAVVDVPSLELKAWTRLPNQFVVGDITWSPDSQFVAVLAGHYEIDRTAILTTLLYHPVPIDDYDLLVYRKGKSSPELRLQIDRNVRYGSGGLLKWR